MERTAKHDGKGGRLGVGPFSVATGGRRTPGELASGAPSLVHIEASGKRRNRREASAVRAALADGREVAFATRHERYRYRRRKPQ